MSYTEEFQQRYGVTDAELEQIQARFGPIPLENFYLNVLLSVLILMRLETLNERIAKLEQK